MAAETSAKKQILLEAQKQRAEAVQAEEERAAADAKKEAEARSTNKAKESKQQKAAAAAEKARITAMLDQARNLDAKFAQQQLVVPGAANAAADVTAAEAKSVALDKEEQMIEASGKSDALKLDAENAKIAMTMESTRNLKVHECPMCCADCAVLCYAVLCRAAVLCCVVLSMLVDRVVLTVLCCAVLTMLYCAHRAHCSRSKLRRGSKRLQT